MVCKQNITCSIKCNIAILQWIIKTKNKQIIDKLVVRDI